MLRVLLILLFISTAVQAQQYTPNWRQDVLEMIEDGRPTAAQALLEEAVRRKNYMTDPIERINHGRFLGDAFSKLGKEKLARAHFDKAMEAALKLEPAWRSLSAVISVLELQAENDDIKNSRQLIQQSLDADLLSQMSKDRYATEIGRYVKRFERASRAQIYTLLGQLQKIEKPAIRKKAFFALTELEFAPFTGEGKYDDQKLPFRMEAFERFLWFSVMAKYYAESDQRFPFNQQVEGMQKAYDRLGEKRQQKYRSIYRMVKKLSYKMPPPEEPTQMAKPKSVRFAPYANSELEDIFYGEN